MTAETHSAAEGPTARRMREKLTETFRPTTLEIIDDSESHRGHGGWREGGETHFKLRIVADAFASLSRVARHRAVNDCLAEELAGPVHALEISADAPTR